MGRVKSWLYDHEEYLRDIGQDPDQEPDLDDLMTEEPESWSSDFTTDGENHA